MTFRDFHQVMSPFVVFSYEDINGVMGGVDRRRLYEWSRKGYIRQIVKGYYLFEELRHTDKLGLLISNKIYSPSYLSMEFIMSINGLIPEAVYTYTAISTKKTSRFVTPFGNFSYRSIKPELFKGYVLNKLEIPMNGRMSTRFVRVAGPEKALFDFFYFRKGSLDVATLDGYRFDLEVLSSMNIDLLNGYIKLSGRKDIAHNLENMLKYYAII